MRLRVQYRAPLRNRSPLTVITMTKPMQDKTQTEEPILYEEKSGGETWTCLDLVVLKKHLVKGYLNQLDLLNASIADDFVNNRRENVIAATGQLIALQSKLFELAKDLEVHDNARQRSVAYRLRKIPEVK